VQELELVPDGRLPRLPPQDGESVRARRHRLAHVGGLLAGLQRQAKVVEQVEQRVHSLLGDCLPHQGFKALGRFAEMAEHIAPMRPVRRSYWEAGRRRELQIVCARCREKFRAALELRIELMVRLSPQAFAPENAAVATQASRHESFWTRLLPRWWSLKRQVAGWYTQFPAATGALLEDLRRLATYHRHVDHCRQVQVQYAADLQLDSGSQPDWEGTLTALAAVDQLEKFLKIPAPLQAVLSEGSSLDREALAVAAADLAHQVVVLRHEWQATEQDYDLSDVAGGPAYHAKGTVGDLVVWLVVGFTSSAR
jgi:hypothetical protein